MRNLTKVLALVLALTMMVSVAAFAASYTDVKAGANYAEAVDVLSDLGLVKGYEDGTFGAENNLTRAEGTAFVLRLMGLEEAAVAAEGSETGFTDVPADHWAAGYVYVAKQNNVVAGNGDGTFTPDEQLTYAAIIKMIVVALGYNPLAAELGEWPGNFISAASQIGLTKGISGKADAAVTRATTARLLYAALTIPKMEKSGVGVNATWEAGETLILDDLGIYKLQGKITSVDAINGTANFAATKQGLAVEGKYKELDLDNENITWDTDVVKAETGVLTAKLQKLVNIPAYIYVADVDGDYVIVSVVERAKLVSTIETTSDMFDSVNSGNEFVYYTDAEQTKDAEFETNDAIFVSVNGATAVSKTATQFYEDYIDGKAYALEIKDTDGDDLYDYVNATLYQYMVVSEVSANKKGVYTIESEILSIHNDLKLAEIKIDTEEEDDTAITIIKGNEEITVDEIAEGDILNIVVNEIDGTTLEEATIYVTNDTVDATVRYVDEEDGDRIVAMTDGNSYKALIADTIVSQTEATWYLSISGKIIYMGDETVASSYNYGFATNVLFEGRATGMKTGTIRVLTTEGKWTTLDLKSTFTANGNSVKIADIDDDGDYDFDDVKSDLDAKIYADGNAIAPEFAINAVIGYKLDSAGAVKEIVVINGNAGDTNNKATSGYNKFAVDRDYKETEDETTFGKYYLDEATVLFNVDDMDELDDFIEETEVTVEGINILKDDNSYTADLINVDEKTDLVAVMVGTFVADIDFESPFFVVSKAIEEVIGEDEIDVVTLVGFENGEEVTYYVSSDDESEISIAGVVDDGNDATVDYVKDVGAFANANAKASYPRGTVMVVNADAEGIITKAVVLGNLNTYVGDDSFTAAASTDIFNGAAVDGDDKGNYVAGYVVSMSSSKTNVWIDRDYDGSEYTDEDIEDIEEGDSYSIKNANVTLYDLTESKDSNKLSAATVSAIDEGTFVIARVDEDKRIIDAIVIYNDFGEEA